MGRYTGINWGMLALGLCVMSCAEQGTASHPTPHASDLVPVTSGKADGAVFDKNNLISDALFTSGGNLTQEHVQEFLEDTPYGTRSYLADLRIGGRTAAEMIIETGEDYDINPLVLLVKLQVEHSLVYNENPSDYALGHAMGCGCYDNVPGCGFGPAGFSAQLVCAADALRHHFNRADAGESTISGWTIGEAKRTLDDAWVTPENAATVSLYTYTPWVLPGTGGNWLFWNVFYRFAYQLGAHQPNWGWIGSSCEEDSACQYEGGVCLETGNHGGVCTMSCDLLCPDSDVPFTSGTFCAAYPSESGELIGQCLSRCDEALFPENDGCATSYRCVDASRFGQEDTVKKVCWPEHVEVPEDNPHSG
jgi:hypothetical protein